MMTAMFKFPYSNSDSDDYDTPPPSHSNSTINPSLKYSKVIEYKPNTQYKILSLETKHTVQRSSP